jgi:hypothetical protein
MVDLQHVTVVANSELLLLVGTMEEDGDLFEPDTTRRNKRIVLYDTKHEHVET